LGPWRYRDNEAILQRTLSIFGRFAWIEPMAMLVEAVDVGNLSAASRKNELAASDRESEDLGFGIASRGSIVDPLNSQTDTADAGAAYVSVAKRILGQVAAAERPHSQPPLTYVHNYRPSVLREMLSWNEPSTFEGPRF